VCREFRKAVIDAMIWRCSRGDPQVLVQEKHIAHGLALVLERRQACMAKHTSSNWKVTITD
jgi:hypothetical protein